MEVATANEVLDRRSGTKDLALRKPNPEIVAESEVLTDDRSEHSARCDETDD
jgi:hypothetical protein